MNKSRNLNMKENYFLEENLLFVNQIFCKYYRVIWAKA